jgi:threonine synthase
MMLFSYISHLFCPKCKKEYTTKEKHQLCECGSPLLVAYDLDTLKANLTPEMIQNRKSSLWRYHELLPVEDSKNVVSLDEGMTPLLEMPKLGKDMDIQHLYMKDEGIIPTGSFKARGAAVGVSKAKELGVQQLAMPTNGNAGAAWALYSSRAEIKATVVMPKDAPTITRNECAVAGANLYLIDGLISDAGKFISEAIKDWGLYDASTLKEPYRIEGKKTMGLEIAEQFSWHLPDVILYPTGGGVGLIGIYKALNELKELGWIKGKLPRLVAVQAENCAPIVKAWNEKKQESEFWPDSTTIAFGINVPKAIGDFLVLEALYNTNGYAIAVEEKQIIEEQKKVALLEGTFICPEGAATFLAARRLREQGWIKEDETVVALNTGLGIKYPNTVDIEVPILNLSDSLYKNV